LEGEGLQLHEDLFRQEEIILNEQCKGRETIAGEKQKPSLNILRR
jgi:hypothetical protein